MYGINFIKLQYTYIKILTNNQMKFFYKLVSKKQPPPPTTLYTVMIRSSQSVI